MATTKNEIKLTVGKALTAIQAIDRLPVLRGKSAYWIGRIGEHMEPIAKQFAKQRGVIQRELSGGKRKNENEFEIPLDKLSEFEDRVEALMEMEETIPFAPISYNDILKEFEDLKDDEGKKKHFEIHPSTMRHLAGVIIVMDDDKPVKDRTAKPAEKAK